ncbi:larval cuticle protein 16/17-like [Homarus americanus]|uniref:Larval cuticle protein 16/17-like n=1 Tax=Homarus americanus TaxID=6706 RepID=A0A8J5TH50_HOMAM|nr:larval cuticle protein 16/17-like [Homarus americanus]KAG7174646.1 Larval cuticle protein 16/17-like [Homarus americanus]
MKTWMLVLLLLGVMSVVAAFPEKLDDSNETHDDDDDNSYEDEPKRPYSFSWDASRYYNGAPDREHKEQRGEDGITRGVFRYVDPRQQVQEIVYFADESGFHVNASNLPQETRAVQAARSRHQLLFDKIRVEHARIAAERALLESQETQEVYE